MKFLADECIYIATIRLLRDLGYDVITIKELNLNSLSDEKVLGLAKKENRLLVTFDQDFGNIFKFPLGTYPGIIIIKVKPQTIENTNSLLQKFLKKTSPKIISKALVVIDKKKTRIRKLTKNTS